MAGGVIYAKPSADTTNVSGEDNVLIINSGYAYQLPLDGLSDYNEIKITWLVSYTTADDSNSRPTGPSGDTSNINENSGDATNQDFNYIGFTYNDTITGLPLTNEVDFIGIRYNTFRARNTSSTNAESRPINCGLFADSTISQDLVAYNNNSSGKNGKFGYYCTSDTTELCASYYPDAENIHDSPPKWRIGQGQPYFMIQNINYWVYQGMGIELIDKGLSTQKLRLKLYQSFDYTNTVDDLNTSGWSNVNNGVLPTVPDKVDLPNLRAVTKGPDFLAEYQDIPWNKDGVALPLPNNFFYYNAFFNLRPRISTITGRRIS